MTTMNRPQPGDPAWLVEALKLDGIKEVPGADHNPEVVKLFAEAGKPGIVDDETAWCAAFVGAMLRRAGYLSTGTLLARDYLKLGHAITNPKRGDIVVFPRGNSEWQGHVAFIAAIDKEWIYAFGGNQNNAVNITRYARKNAIGFRRPVGTIIVAEVQAALFELGFTDVGPIDGELGPKTKAAIAAYETAKGYAPFPDVASLHRHLSKPVIPDAPVEEHEEPIAPPPASAPSNPVMVVIMILIAAMGVALWYFFGGQ